MSAEMAQPTVNDHAEQEKASRTQATQVGQQVQQSQTSAVDQRGQRVAPGRRPLFRT